MTQPIQLVTNEGGPVIRLRIPAFAPPARVIRWGARTFLLDDVAALTYRECLAYTVPDQRVDDVRAAAEVAVSIASSRRQ